MSVSELHASLEEDKKLLMDVENALRYERPGQYTTLLPYSVLSQRIIRILADISGADDVYASSNLSNDLGLDNLDLYELFQQIQDSVTFTSWGKLQFYKWELNIRMKDTELMLSGDNYELDITARELTDTLYKFEPLR